MRPLILLLLICLAPLAYADGKWKPKPPVTPPGTPTQQSAPAPAATPEEDRSKNLLVGCAAAGGLGITALQRTDHPWLYTVAAGAAVSFAGKQASDWSGKETRSCFGGAVLGATGTGLVFGKNFFGWQTAIKF